jgi:hypothetical protein
VIDAKRSEFLMKEFSRKRFNWVKIELDEVTKPEQDEQSSAPP